MKIKLSLETLRLEAGEFASTESLYQESTIYGVTDGKAIGTYFEHKFKAGLADKYEYQPGNSARGIDFPELHVDMKVTRITQPQSSCPFKSARQKIYGLGYSLLVFVYEKTDAATTQTGCLNILHTVFVEAGRTADFQMTSGIRQILDNEGNADDLIAFMRDRYLPVDDIQAQLLAEEVLTNPPQLGYLTISNALQWRLQYRRVIDKAGVIEGIFRVS